jgi:phosphatidate cytidylyltransferase
MSNFIQRAITGLLFSAIVVGSIIAHPLVYAAIFMIVIAIGIKEFKQMVDDDFSRLHYKSALLISLFLYLYTLAVHLYGAETKWITLLIPLIWWPFLYELFSGNQKPFRNIALTFLGIIYVALPVTSLHLLVFKDGIYNFIPLLCFFILVWVNDSGAYLVGVNFGRHKLYERISPKKTIEGFVGGITATVIVAIVISRFSSYGNIYLWIISALVISIFGTAGDLIESMLKRSQNCKDSGRFLPGHGGMLDRFDAALFAAPMVSMLFYYFA